MNIETNKQRFADEFGENYDIFHEAVPWHDEFQVEIVKALEVSFASNKDPVLVEAGFGTGITTKMVLSAFPNAKITAIDNVANMADKTRRYVGIDALKNTQLIIGDLYEELTKLPSESTDGFYSGYVIHNIPAVVREKIFPEIFRILKPGGVFVNGDRIALDDIEKQKDALARAIEACGVFVTKHNDPDYYLEWVRHYLRDEEPDLIFRQSDQLRLLDSAGFKNTHYIFQKGLESVCCAVK